VNPIAEDNQYVLGVGSQELDSLSNLRKKKLFSCVVNSQRGRIDGVGSAGGNP
jgi:hypothetical protein